MATVAEAVKESLIGTAVEPDITSQIKANFTQYAKTDAENGEQYMTEEEFVNAIAPKSEDYVSPVALSLTQVQKRN